MSAADSAFDVIRPVPTAAGSKEGAPSASSNASPKMQRVDAQARVSAKLRDGRSVLDGLYQRGSAKIHMPKTAGFEAVVINTAGGLTGGDRLQIGIDAGAGTHLSAMTQTAERVYRSSGGAAEVDVTLNVREGARLDWMPQETILFDEGRLSRRLIADVAEGATLLAVESFVFGREAMGETMNRGFVSDQWRIRRGGRPLFADAVRIEGAVAETLDACACLGGARGCATLLYVAPDAEDRLDGLRTALEGFDAGASAWNGLVTARIVAMNAQTLRIAISRAICALRDGAMPRVWTM